MGSTSDLNEHLGPLRRFLDSRVGRPWDDVFSEICARIDRSSAVQDHVRDHVEDFVTVHVLLMDGVPRSGEPGWRYGRPLHEAGWPWYVCPITGVLCRVKFPGRKSPRPPQEERPPRYIPVSDTLQCRFLDGAWHLVSLKPLPQPPASRQLCRGVDVLLDRPVAGITAWEAQSHYGVEVYAVASRRLSRRELKQFPIPARWWT